MTERLTALLHHEADTLAVPPAPAADTLAAAHRARRRRTTTRAAAVGGTVALVAALAAGVTTVGGGDDRGEPAPHQVATDPDGTTATTADVGATFGFGDTVYLRGGAVTARVQRTVQAFYETSAGVLVRSNATGNSDGGAPFYFDLVTPDGTVSSLGLTLGEVVPSTDPTQPYLAYAEQGMGGDAAVQVVVVDVTTGDEAARVDVPGPAPETGWDAPPVSLDGDSVYLPAADGGTTVVDWRTGETTRTTLPEGTGYDVSGGHAVLADGSDLAVLDATTGEHLLGVPADGFTYLTLSPDGRYALLDDKTVYRVDDGASTVLPGRGYGWTSDGDPFRVTGRGIEVCDPDAGTCATSALPEGLEVGRNDFVRLLGSTYES